MDLHTSYIKSNLLAKMEVILRWTSVSVKNHTKLSQRYWNKPTTPILEDQFYRPPNQYKWFEICRIVPPCFNCTLFEKLHKLPHASLVSWFVCSTIFSSWRVYEIRELMLEVPQYCYRAKTSCQWYPLYINTSCCTVDTVKRMLISRY